MIGSDLCVTGHFFATIDFGGNRMRKAQKQDIMDMLQTLHEAHEEIKNNIDRKNYILAQDLLSQCQEGAISIGTAIEKSEGEGFVTVESIEKYCDLVFQIHEELNDANANVNINKIHKLLKKQLICVENSIKNDIRIRRIAVFLPYKASMWDSLESVWMAADADPDCDAYVVPIPYYDKNPDGSIKERHYEGDLYPDYVPITKCEEFDFAVHPDMIFIHNPYDGWNTVTSVPEFFYSDNLKKFTDCLVYIPYFATAGGMAEGQSLCPAYINADYIVIQSEKYRKYYDPRIPDEKFLALGSPKFDSVIRKCQNPPEPPAEWKAKMIKADGSRKKVYFYNTSIGGMLGDTATFLKKMQYVFEIFKGRDDVCILWRPHPLLESTFDSMRPQYKTIYEALKNEFVESGLGIYDTTPHIEDTIAVCDAYIGDSGTSVTSLFGVAGKPLFIFNNYINTLPEKDDWRGEIINPCFDMFGDDRFHVTPDNKLWYSENNDYHYQYYMDLGTGYSGGYYYMKALQKGDKIYVIPQYAQHMLVIKDKRIIQKVEFKDKIVQAGAFYSYWHTDKYIFLIPYKYPYMIRFEISTGELYYISGVSDFAAKNVNGEWCLGGVAQYGNELVIASPVNSDFLFIDMDTLQTRVLNSNSKQNTGTQTIVPDGKNLWLMPLNGMTLTCWNPETNEIHEYNDRPDDFKAIKFPIEMEVQERPFGAVAISRQNDKENIIVSPCWGNMYLSLDTATGNMTKWGSTIGDEIRGKNGYYRTGGMGGFAIDYTRMGNSHQHMWYAPERRLYEIDIDTKEYKEIDITFDYRELENNEAGFMEESEWMQYCCKENSFNTLKDLLDDNITGNQFDRNRQLKAFSQINVNTEGTCGEKVYQFLKSKE